MERFEKVLKASFEGRERRAVMESERETIQKLCTRECITDQNIV